MREIKMSELFAGFDGVDLTMDIQELGVFRLYAPEVLPQEALVRVMGLCRFRFPLMLFKGIVTAASWVLPFKVELSLPSR